MPATNEAEMILPKEPVSGKDAPVVLSHTAGPKLADIKKVDLEDSPSLKRKDGGTSSSHRFKVVSQLVIAMRRFQASLNPTYTYGKRPASSNSSGGAVAASFKKSPEHTQEVTSGSFARQFSRPGEPGAPKVARNHNFHGNKTSFVFRALPPHPDEDPEHASLQHLPSGKSVANGTS
ncbi:hypothetical protein COCSUDRAFT_66969 [Coccomyxa subellipsoidea C-169]|uniref:Uncharacterized protein n=1 Tax=Coccomyxa subellipsoidea (strain C-169) TaxID=574566 RepID=I0YT88_COCSC|nr:hypothetical protein COCSUDRAFT_66969 [Coccomyxa subellipsoidea C-169]EIE21607.1 hypothetical protein COCSUDRAFT_66969 [Coccomyxa subellipsoidea C-169]|eukprot:XP_005646151.1 hypothetical protein COCSUDRAFT_66969 [Coccomyxa subellipsoidea C-169]